MFLLTAVLNILVRWLTGGYLLSLDHLMMTTDIMILEDFNAHHSA